VLEKMAGYNFILLPVILIAIVILKTVIMDDEILVIIKLAYRKELISRSWL